MIPREIVGLIGMGDQLDAIIDSVWSKLDRSDRSKFISYCCKHSEDSTVDGVDRLAYTMAVRQICQLFLKESNNEKTNEAW